MKYIIPQSRLHQVIFKYLDMQNLNIVKRGVYVYFTENVRDKYGFLKYNYYTESLFILKVFADNISDMFGLSVKESGQIISSWVENTLGVKVNLIKIK